MTAPATALMGERAQTESRAMPLLAAGIAALFGLILLFGTGFAHPQALHNAAHDVRHATGFPCH